MPVGVIDAGAWHYSFAYDIVARHEPSVLEAARFIGEIDARQKIIELYFGSVGAAQLRDLIKLFGWKPADINLAIQRLIENHIIIDHQEIENHAGEWMILTELL
jgi:hypothetical protein